MFHCKVFLDLNLGTVWNNWNTAWTGQVEETNRRTRTTRFGGNQIMNQVFADTQQRIGMVRSGVRTFLVPNTVRTILVIELLT